ncbi:hypothetical protein [Aquimarina aquimarini]|uniref:hypothetical protein n=1 Tax=Aquimarina aquimarini TaxID=1191734 RepID=UPI000D55EF46|nr:hypothetical protein [Aquimarina aquimarini]
MKLLLLKLALFSILCLTIVTFVLVRYGGNIDFFYEKFTTPKAKSMIIGDSRSFQGIQPRVLNEYFDGINDDLPILNYSFTIAQALIGPLYNNSIFKKIDTTSRQGIFIISITPEMLTSKKGFDNQKGEFREQGQPPHNMNIVDVSPNYEYIVKNLSFFHFRGAFSKNFTLHKDGWLEETNLPENEDVLEQYKIKQINLFKEGREDYPLSKVRIKSLHHLIRKLEKYGTVFLVRMPISKEFLKYEEQYYPSFSHTIDSITKIDHIPYFDFNEREAQYKTYDGHHINKYDGVRFTEDLCDSISNYLKNK